MGTWHHWTHQDVFAGRIVDGHKVTAKMLQWESSALNAFQLLRDRMATFPDIFYQMYFRSQIQTRKDGTALR